MTPRSPRLERQVPFVIRTRLVILSTLRVVYIGSGICKRVSLAGLGPVKLKVGAIQSQSTNFDTKHVVGGLMGLADLMARTLSLWQMRACDRVWGICMNPSGSVSNSTLTVGGVDETLSDGPINYVPDQGFIFRRWRYLHRLEKARRSR